MLTHSSCIPMLLPQHFGWAPCLLLCRQLCPDATASPSGWYWHSLAWSHQLCALLCLLHGLSRDLAVSDNKSACLSLRQTGAAQGTHQPLFLTRLALLGCGIEK